MLIHILLIIVLQIYPSLGGERHLKFTPNPSVARLKYDYVMEHHDIVLDAFTTQQILVLVLRDQDFTFSCAVENLAEQFRIKKAELCWKLNLHDEEQCAVIMKNKATVNVYRNGFHIEYDDKKGFVATKTSETLQGYYYCRLANEYDAITSNNIEFQNIDFYRSVLSFAFTPNKHLDVDKARSISDSHIFDYGNHVDDSYKTIPQWILPEVEKIIRWRVCPVEDHDYTYTWGDCFNNEIQMMPNVDYVQFANYSIKLFDHVYKVHDKFVLENYNFVTNMQMNTYPIKGTQETDQSTSAEIKLQTIDEKTVHFREGENNLFKYKLSAAYTGNVLKYNWKRISLPLSEDFKQTERDLIFPSLVTREHEGSYILTLTSEKTKISYDLEFYVFVDSVPTVSPDYQIPQTIVNLPSQIIDWNLRIIGNNLNVNFKINNIPLGQEKQVFHQKYQDNLYENYPYLNQFQFTSSSQNYPQFVDLKIKVANMNTLLEERGQFLALTGDIQSSIGILRVRTLLITVEWPVFKRTVVENDCDQMCPIDRDYLFSCSVFPKEYLKRNFVINYSWLVNDEPLQGNISDSLIIRKDQSRYLGKVRINCKVVLLAPQTFMNANTKFEKIYDSDNDQSINKLLQTTVVMVAAKKTEIATKDIPMIIISSLVIVSAVSMCVLIIVLFILWSGKDYSLGTVDISDDIVKYDDDIDNEEAEQVPTNTIKGKRIFIASVSKKNHRGLMDTLDMPLETIFHSNNKNLLYMKYKIDIKNVSQL